jgi:DNA-binding MarR family transcriptional regulator
MSRSETERAAVEAQRQVMGELFGAALQHLLQVDLSMAQMKALSVIDRQPSCSMGMLSEMLGVKAPAATLLVDRLVRAGLARRLRDAADGRRVMVEPTDRGREVLAQVREGGQALLEGWVGRLADADLAALRQGLEALASVARGFPVSHPAGHAGRR